MTALQDWLSNRPLDPNAFKAFVCGALRSLTADEPAKVEEYRLLRKGVERC